MRNLLAYRGFVFENVKREFQSKYRNSLLGAAWGIINPMAMILVYTVIFSEIMHAKLPGVESGYAYSIYLCSGALTWGFFSEVILRGQTIFLENANFIKKINFPRILLPVLVVINASINFSIVFIVFAFFLISINSWPGWVVVSTLFVLLIQIMFAIGLGVFLAVINVFFRDVGQFFAIFLQFWFWFTPIVYPETILPDSVRGWLWLNPMRPILDAYHAIYVEAAWPDWFSLIYPAVCGLLICTWALFVYRNNVDELVDEL